MFVTQFAHLLVYRSLFLLSPSASSGKSLYLLQHYLSGTKFSYFYRWFLAVLTVGIEPTKYYEVVSQLE